MYTSYLLRILNFDSLKAPFNLNFLSEINLLVKVCNIFFLLLSNVMYKTNKKKIVESSKF